MASPRRSHVVGVFVLFSISALFAGCGGRPSVRRLTPPAPSPPPLRSESATRTPLSRTSSQELPSPAPTLVRGPRTPSSPADAAPKGPLSSPQLLAAPPARIGDAPLAGPLAGEEAPGGETPRGFSLFSFSDGSLVPYGGRGLLLPRPQSSALHNGEGPSSYSLDGLGGRVLLGLKRSLGRFFLGLEAMLFNQRGRGFDEARNPLNEVELERAGAQGLILFGLRF